MTFHEDDSCLDRTYDLVLASSSLQYAPDWRGYGLTDFVVRIGINSGDAVVGSMGSELFADVALHPSFPEAELDRQRKQRAQQVTGSRTEYHPVAAHWVIAELLETLNPGRTYVELVHERVANPAGVPAVLGPAAALEARGAGVEAVEAADDGNPASSGVPRSSAPVSLSPLLGRR